MRISWDEALDDCEAILRMSKCFRHGQSGPALTARRRVEFVQRGETFGLLVGDGEACLDLAESGSLPRLVEACQYLFDANFLVGTDKMEERIGKSLRKRRPAVTF